MTLATFLGADWQTLADAFGLGGIYALMAVGIGLVFGIPAALGLLRRAGFTALESRRDLAGIPRVVAGTLGSSTLGSEL